MASGRRQRPMYPPQLLCPSKRLGSLKIWGRDGKARLRLQATYESRRNVTGCLTLYKLYSGGKPRRGIALTSVGADSSLPADTDTWEQAMSHNPNWSFKPPPGEYSITKKPTKLRKRWLKSARKKAKAKRKYSDVLKDEFYGSREWMSLRYRVLRKYGGCCMLCGVRAGNGVVIHVDHIKPKSTHQHLALRFDNMQVLCDVCNLGKGNRDDTDWRPKDAPQDLLPDGALDHMRNL